MRRFASFLLAVLVLPLHGGAARADWPSSPTVNVPVTTAPGSQGLDAVVTDGHGGMIAIWEDQNYQDPSSWRVLAQRVDAAGSVRWTPGGVVVCTATGPQSNAQAVPDGAGGFLVAWSDGRNGGNDLFAQRVGANGNRLWPDAGVSLCTGTNAAFPQVVTDGRGGMVVLWIDSRDGAPNSNLFAQSIDSLGATRWTANGARITSGGVDWQTASLAPDDSSGVIVTWHRFAVNTVHPFAQRIDAAGQLRWGAAGVQAGTGARQQATPRATSDEAGGAIIVWAEDRTGSGTSGTTTGQHVDSAGAILWDPGGIPLGPASGDQEFQAPVPDGAGGAVVVWSDLATTASWAQRVTGSGTVLWTANGAPVAPAHQDHYFCFPHPQPDGSGGVFAPWTDYRTGDGDAYVQHLNASGAATWTADGVPVCTAPGVDGPPLLTPDGAGGVLVAWSDPRSNISWDVYAQNVTAAGTLGGTVSVPLTRTAIGLAVRALGSDPHRGTLTIDCALPDASPAVVRLLDVSGRCVERSTLAGSQRVAWTPASPRLTPGVYLVQLAQGGRSTATRIVWLR